MFTNPIIQSKINELNGTSFRGLWGFGMHSSSNTTYYYVIDGNGAGKVYIFSDEWKFISFKSFNAPSYMISIGNSLYLTGHSNVWKIDQDLNILIEYKLYGGYPSCRGISYNPSNGFIYVAVWGFSEIQVFNLNLTFIRRFSTSPHSPWPITESSNKLYVGTLGGILLVYQNEEIINQFNGCDGNNGWLTSILFDPNGYMATSCSSHPTPYKLYLFSPNGSFTDKSITTPQNPFYIGFDSKGRFIQISYVQISIYN